MTIPKPLAIKTPYLSIQHCALARDGVLAMIPMHRSAGQDLQNEISVAVHSEGRDADFLVRFSNGKTLVPEIKGEGSERSRSKRVALVTWIEGVNVMSGFAARCWDVVFQPVQIHVLVEKHMVA